MTATVTTRTTARPFLSAHATLALVVHLPFTLAPLYDERPDDGPWTATAAGHEDGHDVFVFVLVKRERDEPRGHEVTATVRVDGEDVGHCLGWVPEPEGSARYGDRGRAEDAVRHGETLRTVLRAIARAEPHVD